MTRFTDTATWYGEIIDIPRDVQELTWLQNLQAATVKTGMDLGLFVCLTESDKPLAVDEISKRTGGDPELTSMPQKAFSIFTWHRKY